MILDTHLHTSEYSADSFLPVVEAVGRAREMGIDGLCITDHDSLGAREVIERWRREMDFPLFLGVEVLTTRGDIVCFGLHEAPRPATLTPEELIKYVQSCDGCAVAAHPYRNNNRGLGDLIGTLLSLNGVECFNGSTTPEANLHALEVARAAGRSLLGAGDAHWRDRVGLFATEFDGELRDERDLIAAVREGCCHPLAWNGTCFTDPEAFCREQLKNCKQ